MKKELTEEEIHNMSLARFVMTEEIWNSISDKSKHALLYVIVPTTSEDCIVPPMAEDADTITINEYLKEREKHLAFFKQCLIDHYLPDDATEADLFIAQFIESQKDNVWDSNENAYTE